jgi:hypothetical protein
VYDVWRGHQGFAQRSLLVIDRDRAIRCRWATGDASALPDLDAAIAALKEPM